MQILISVSRTLTRESQEHWFGSTMFPHSARARGGAERAWSSYGVDVDHRRIAAAWGWPSEALALSKIASALKRHRKGAGINHVSALRARARRSRAGVVELRGRRRPPPDRRSMGMAFGGPRAQQNSERIEAAQEGGRD